MLKFSSVKAIASIKGVLILLAGIIGAKTLKGIVSSKFPQYAQYANYGVLALALVGTMAGQTMVQNVAKGGLLFAAVQVLNQFVPSSASRFMPQISGLGNAQLPSYDIPPEAVTLGDAGYGSSGMGDAASFQMG